MQLPVRERVRHQIQEGAELRVHEAAQFQVQEGEGAEVQLQERAQLRVQEG